MPDNDEQERSAVGKWLLGVPADWQVAASAADGGLLPRARRWRTPSRNPRRAMLVLALVLAVHALVVWLVWRTPPPATVVHPVIGVTLINPVPAPALPPPLPVPPPPLPLPAAPAPTPVPAAPAPAPVPAAPAPAPVRAPARHHRVPRTPGSMSATLENAKGRPLKLYGAQGQVLLPPQKSKPAPVPAYRAPRPKGESIMTIRTPLKYKPNRFSKIWSPHQSLGAETVGRAFDKAVQATTLRKTIHLPGGGKLHCVLSPLVLLAGCPGSRPEAPPRNDNDIRLSLPPAETLTGKKVPLPGAASGTSQPAAAPGG